MRFEMPLELLFDCRLKFCRTRFQADLLLIVHVPFGFARRDIESAGGQVGHHQLPGSVRLEPLISDHADVDLPPFNVLFGDRRRLVLAMNEIPHALSAFHHRGPPMPERCRLNLRRSEI